MPYVWDYGERHEWKKQKPEKRTATTTKNVTRRCEIVRINSTLTNVRTQLGVSLLNWVRSIVCISFKAFSRVCACFCRFSLTNTAAQLLRPRRVEVRLRYLQQKKTIISVYMMCVWVCCLGFVFPRNSRIGMRFQFCEYVQQIPNPINNGLKMFCR